MAAVSKNISETLKSINLEKPTLSTLAQKGSDELVQLFLSENIDLGNEEKETSQSQLYIASFWGLYDIVKKLVCDGADVNFKNSNTLWTPLHAASFQEHGKIVMFLLSQKADPYSEDFQGRTPADFGSASDRVWSLFAASACMRTPKKDLIDKGVLRKANPQMIGRDIEQDSNAMRKANDSLEKGTSQDVDDKNQINYDSKGDTKDTNKRTMHAATVDGDVLAGDNAQDKNKEDDQPTFNAWRN